LGTLPSVFSTTPFYELNDDEIIGVEKISAIIDKTLQSCGA
jgi:hypothetical protein